MADSSVPTWATRIGRSIGYVIGVLIGAMLVVVVLIVCFWAVRETWLTLLGCDLFA